MCLYVCCRISFVISRRSATRLSLIMDHYVGSAWKYFTYKNAPQPIEKSIKFQIPTIFKYGETPFYFVFVSREIRLLVYEVL